MTEGEVANEVRHIIARVAPEVEPATIRPDKEIRRSLGIAPFYDLRILAAISERFGVIIPDNDQGRFRSLNASVAQIRELGLQ